MLQNINTNEQLNYEKLTEEDQHKRGILGRLKGIIADFKNPTRNGRKYTEELWEKVFDSPIMEEKIQNRCVFGELGHPADRTEIDMEKIAICLAEKPKKSTDGKLYGVFDILDTPNGRILKTLCDYGCNVGVSSRGSGDTFTDMNGQETVDPDSYECECWDVVLLPAVKEARMTLVAEGLGQKTFKQALVESLNNASETDRKVMEATLQDLGITLNEGNDQMTDDEILDEIAGTLEIKDVEAFKNDVKSGNGEKYTDAVEAKCCDTCKARFKQMIDIKDESLNINKEQDIAVDNNEAMVKQFQDMLKKNADLENKIIELQEKLSVSYTKETNDEEARAKYKRAVSKLSESAKKANALETKVNKLEESLTEANRQLNASNEKIQLLEKAAQLSGKNKESLKESISSREDSIRKLNENVNKLQRDINLLQAKSDKEKESLNESIANLNKDLDLKKAEYSQKLDNANKLVEKYKKIATGAVDKYINSQAVRLGVNANEIKNRLPESYTFEDIDKATTEVQEYKLNISKLPFRTNALTENMTVKVNGSKNESIVPADRYSNFDDEVDSQLKQLAGLN